MLIEGAEALQVRIEKIQRLAAYASIERDERAPCLDGVCLPLQRVQTLFWLRQRRIRHIAHQVINGLGMIVHHVVVHASHRLPERLWRPTGPAPSV